MLNRVTKDVSWWKILLLATIIRIFINVMLHIDENSHLNVFLLSSCNRFDFTFLAIWFVEQKYGSTFTLWMLLTGLGLRCGPFLFTDLDSNPDFSPQTGHLDILAGPLPFIEPYYWAQHHESVTHMAAMSSRVDTVPYLAGHPHSSAADSIKLNWAG